MGFSLIGSDSPDSPDLNRKLIGKYPKMNTEHRILSIKLIYKIDILSNGSNLEIKFQKLARMQKD